VEVGGDRSQHRRTVISTDAFADGDGTSVYDFNNTGWISQTVDFAFCLGAACTRPDSLTIKVVSSTSNRLYFKATVAGLA